MDESAPPPRPDRKKWRRRLGTLVVVLALLGGLLWGGWYVYNRGFTRKWRELLADEMRRRGFDFSARRLTLNPFEGLIAENVRIYSLDAEHTQLIYVDRVAVDIDLVAFIRHKPFLNSLDLRGARLTLPVEVAAGADTTRKLKLRHLSAKVAFLPDELRLIRAEGEFYGLQLSASGSLLHPENYSPAAGPANEAEATRRRVWVRRFIDELDRLTPERSPPRLEVRFQGDLAKPGSLRASAQLEGEALRRGGVRVDRLLARFDYTAGAFHLQQGEITDHRGTLSVQGDFNPDTTEAHFQVQSGIDLLAFAHEFYDPHLLADLRLRESPRLQLEGHARFASLANHPPAALGGVRTASNDLAPPAVPPIQLTGRLALGRFAYRDFEFSGAETDFSWNLDRWYLRGLRVTRPGGEHEPQTLTADVLAEPTGCRVRLTSTLDPVPFASLLPAAGQEVLAKTEFHELPRVEFSAAAPSLTALAGVRAEGKITLGRTRYRGASLNHLRMDVAFADGLLTARHIALERDEGTAAGDLVTYDLDKHELRLDNLRCNLDLAQVGLWLDPDVYHTILPFKFRRPPALVMNGNLQFMGGRNSHFVTNVSAPGGMDYVFIKKTLPFQGIAGQVVFNEERMWLNDVRADLLGGQAHGTLNLTLGGKGSAHDYAAAMDWKDLDFARLTKLYFDYDSAKGLLSGNYKFTGRGDNPGTLRGSGAVLVDHGNIFAIPFMGPLSPVVGAVLPGLGFDEAHQASANFLTDNGKIYMGDLDIRGRGFSLFGRGWLGYMTDTMNFRVALNTRGLPGMVLSPMSKLFEYSSQGPLSKPVWRPQVLSKAPPLATPAPAAPAAVQPR